MSKTRAQKRSKEEQLQLITECRQSGLSDAEWCRQHNVCVSTFYNWIKRLRKEACEVPKASYGHSLTESPKPDIVKVDILPDIPEVAVFSASETTAELNIDNSHTIEIAISDITIRVTNQANPALLAQMIRILRGKISC